MKQKCYFKIFFFHQKPPNKNSHHFKLYLGPTF